MNDKETIRQLEAKVKEQANIIYLMSLRVPRPTDEQLQGLQDRVNSLARIMNV